MIFLLLLHFLLVSLGTATDIATFSDSECKNTFRDLSGPNGYPNGTCSHLNTQGVFGSFQVVGMDNGCTVTIYGNDTGPQACSGEAVFASLATCYNTSWVYYSIDSCSTPNTATNTSSPSSVQAHKPAPAGAIAGGIVGGVVVIAALAAIGYYVGIQRRKKAKHNERNKQVEDDKGDDEGSVEPHEMPTKENIQELPANKHLEDCHELGVFEEGTLRVLKSPSKMAPTSPVELPGNDVAVDRDTHV